jgi:hypothetical protein
LLREPRKRKRAEQRGKQQRPEQRYQYPIVFHFSTFFRVALWAFHSSQIGHFFDL